MSSMVGEVKKQSQDLLKDFYKTKKRKSTFLLL